jgi:hypothetical protein
MKNVINFNKFKKNNAPLDLSVLDNNFKGYVMLPDMTIIGPRKKKLAIQKDLWGYPMVKLRGKYYKLHVIIAKLFVKNDDPVNKQFVDHIDRNKNNYDPSNLRWVSNHENQNNKDSKKWTHRTRYESYLDKELTNLSKIFTDEEIYKQPSKETGVGYKESIRRSIKFGKSFDGFYWKIVDLDLVCYLDSIGCDLKDIKDGWVLHYSNKFKVHPLGLVMNREGITVGFLHSSSNSNHPVRAIHSNRRRYLIHRVVAEVFLNDNKPLDKNKFVDHINTISTDNRVTNLRICSQKENMNNELTKQKVSKPIINTETGKVYGSITECAKDNNVTVGCIWARLNGRRPSKGYRYL